MEKPYEIILTVSRLDTHIFDCVLETKTARFRDKSEGFIDFISTAKKLNDGGNTIINSKEFIDIKKNNSEMTEFLKQLVYGCENGLISDLDELGQSAKKLLKEVN